MPERENWHKCSWILGDENILISNLHLKGEKFPTENASRNVRITITYIDVVAGMYPTFCRNVLSRQLLDTSKNFQSPGNTAGSRHSEIFQSGKPDLDKSPRQPYFGPEIKNLYAMLG